MPVTLTGKGNSVPLACRHGEPNPELRPQL
jgi:hypothetical protein